MPIKRLSQTSLVSFQKHSNMLAGNPAYSPPVFDLLETTVLSSAASSVTFSSLGSYSAYKHLQIRAVARSNRASATSSLVDFRFNSDTGSNYAWHELIGDGSTVTSGAGTSQTSVDSIWRIPASTAGANAYGAAIADFLDCFDTSKNTTMRILQGNSASGTGDEIGLGSGLWNNTAAITSITIIEGFSSTFTIGSRFSLYGVK